jgi:MFS family permease
MIVVAVAAFFSAFFGPAIASATPEIVGLDKIQQANGANSIVQSITSIAGVLFGIIAFGLFSFEVAALINGISFVLSGFSEMFIRAEHKEEVPPSHVSMIEDFRIGFRYILNKEGFLAFMIFALFLNFAVAPLFSVAIPALMRIQLERSAWEIGWLNIVFSIAMMAAGIVIGSIQLRRPSRTIRTSIFFLTMSVLLLSGAIWIFNEGWVTYSTLYILMLVSHIAIAVFMMGTNVPLNTGMVKLIDPAVRGRVFSTLGALAGGLVPLSIFMSGFVIQATSVAFLGVLCSGLLLVPMLGFLMNRKVRGMLASIEPAPEQSLELANALE